MGTGKIDLLAHERHFFDHLLPMFLNVPPEMRGSIITRVTLGPYVQGLISSLEEKPNIITYANRGHVPRILRRSPRDLVLCSASGDLSIAYKARRWAVFTQHGAGQSFTKKSPSYAGWPHHKNVAMFLHPGPHPAGKDAAIYGADSVRIIGCPKMDAWHRGETKKADRRSAQASGKLPVVVFSTHWDCKVVPETRSAFWHQLPGLEALSKLNGKEIRLMGHGHPRMLSSIRPEYEKRGIEVVEKFGDVLRMGDLYVMDHMSTLYEFASAGEGGNGRPVVVMNCPEYRRGVNHGLRWWDAANVGIQVDDPADMVGAVRRALEDGKRQQKARRQAVDMCYSDEDGASNADGMAAERAGAAIVEAVRAYSDQTSMGMGRLYSPMPTNPVPNPNNVKRYSASKWSTGMKTHFDKKQVALRAINRLRNFNRGYTPRGGGVERGINALRGRLFFTDEQHAKELVLQKQAEYAHGVEFPGENGEYARPEKADRLSADAPPSPIEKLTAEDMPEIVKHHVGGGYYDIVEDGHAKEKVRGAAQADAAVRARKELWLQENVQPEAA